MPLRDDPRPELTWEEFRLLRDAIYDYCGIYVRDDLKFVLERRLWGRVEALGLTSFNAYYRYLRFDPGQRAELEAAVEVVATNETYFFREPQQLRAFSEELIPRLYERGQKQRRLRLWSAGCSTGEEPYTLAMLLHASGRFSGWDVHVYGTDISRRVLTAARRAEYGPAALRATTPEQLAEYFEPAGTRYRVRPFLQSQVTFGHLNLVEEEAARAVVPKVDAIFCRNVLIYFDLAARRRVLSVLYDRLNDGGYLLLGHSETLLNLTADFELVHLQGDLVYRRPERAP